MGKNKSKSSSSDGLPLMGLIKPAVGVAVALAGYYFLQGIQTEVSILLKSRSQNDLIEDVLFIRMFCCVLWKSHNPFH